MSEQELNALITILNRAPMTPAELLWLQELLKKLQPTQPILSAIPTPPGEL